MDMSMEMMELSVATCFTNSFWWGGGHLPAAEGDWQMGPAGDAMLARRTGRTGGGNPGHGGAAVQPQSPSKSQPWGFSAQREQ